MRAAIAKVETALDASGQKLSSRATTPIQAGYRPELDTSEELNLSGMRHYQVRSESSDGPSNLVGLIF
jgi:hypothetical protein